MEIREIEFAMLKFYFSLLSPYEMKIKEEPIEGENKRFSNSLIGNHTKEL